MTKKYSESGVNLEAGYESVRRIKSHVERTKIKGSIDSLGAFGGMFDLSVLNLKEPILVSGTDGVGTKLMIAQEMDKHDTIGIDAVAMCVNDILAQGATPLYFLDYIALGKNIPEKVESIVKGVADGCVEAECTLIGGETAEMPGMYSENEYDIAGFAVGVVEKSKLITGERVSEGDVIIGLPSSGFHSNGFSLIRKIIEDKKLDIKRTYRGLDKPLGEVLLEPTKIYVKSIKKILEYVTPTGMCHITGGGFIENIPRIVPKGVVAEVSLDELVVPGILNFFKNQGDITTEEMFNVFNMGIGFIIVVYEKDAGTVFNILNACGEKPIYLGQMEDWNEEDHGDIGDSRIKFI